MKPRLMSLELGGFRFQSPNGCVINFKFQLELTPPAAKQNHALYEHFNSFLDNFDEAKAKQDKAFPTSSRKEMRAHLLGLCQSPGNRDAQKELKDEIVDVANDFLRVLSTGRLGAAVRDAYLTEFNLVQ